ncbi:MAG: M28 family peptidase [Thermodesulfobacteriota bacterium]
MDIPIEGVELHRIMTDLVGLGPRVSGSEAEKAAAEYIARAFRQAGLTGVAYESFSIRNYALEEASLVARSGGRTYELPGHPFWYAAGGRVTAPAVFLGLGGISDFRSADIRGKIVVVESRILLNYLPTHFLLQTYHQAVAGGAAGYLVFVNAPYDLAPRYNHLKEDEPPGPIPALLLTYHDGLLLRHLLEGQPGGAEIELSVRAREWPAETGDVVGWLPGSKEVIIVGSHYDSVYAGAADNAAANAGLIALARWAAARPGLKPTLVFCAHPGHEVNVGARSFVARHADLLADACLYLSLDGFASSGYVWSPSGVIPTGRDEKRGISLSDNPLLLDLAVAAVKEQGLLPAAYVPASDIVFNKDLEGRFYETGVPFLMIIGKPIWYHTRADTADLITPDQLRRSFLAHAGILDQALAAGPRRIKDQDRRPHDEVIRRYLRPEAPEMGLQGGRGLAFGILPDCVPVGEPAWFFLNDFANAGEVVLDMAWDFGDGQAGRGPITGHVYPRPGRFEVTVTLTDSSGARSRFHDVLWVR